MKVRFTVLAAVPHGEASAVRVSAQDPAACSAAVGV